MKQQQLLDPVSPPIGILPEYIRDKPTTLVLKEKVLSWSGADYGIKDVNGNVIARCKGKFPSLHGKRVITDPAGKTLYHLREKLMAFHKTFIAEDDTGGEIFRMKKQISLKAKMEATFINVTDGSETVISLRGGFMGFDATLTVGSNGKGQPIAQINRHFWNKRELANAQTYYVTVAPGVDIALVAGICICFDEAKNDSHAGGGSGGGGGG